MGDDDSVQKVTCQNDHKVPNAVMLVIEREDHTLGNILRMQLLEDDQVLFSGYRVPHPLEPAIQVRVQTRSEDPGPVQVLHNAIDSLKTELGTIDSRFQAAIQDFRRT